MARGDAYERRPWVESACTNEGRDDGKAITTKMGLHGMSASDAVHFQWPEAVSNRPHSLSIVPASRPPQVDGLT